MDAFRIIEDTEPGWWNDGFRDIKNIKCSCGRWMAAAGTCLTKHKEKRNAPR